MAPIDFDCLVIGAGVVGLACAATLGQTQSTLLLEAEERFGKHTSSRSSEVLHSGIYYPPGTLKAELCVEGNRLARPFFEEHGVPWKPLGKYVVAMDEAELPRLRTLQAQGLANGTTGLEWIDGADFRSDLRLQTPAAALWVPSTAILDSHRFMAALERLFMAQGGTVVYGAEVVGIRHEGDHFRLSTANGDQVTCQKLINCAGLNAHLVATRAGLDIDALGLRQHWCKGVYFKSRRLPDYPHLIYPIPPASGQSLGIHLTVNLAGEVRFGPDTEFIERIDYRFPEGRLDGFREAIARYLDLPLDDLAPDDTGIRAKLQGPGDLFRDFYIREESDQGLPGLVNCIGIESPGLTSALAIARRVNRLLGNS